MKQSVENEIRNKTSSAKADYKVAIIGAGFSGLGMGIKLKKAGITSFIIVEAASEVGGTWRDTKYPGSAVDVPTHLYSYSFEQNPNWKRMFAKSEEIQQYILDVTEKYQMRPFIKFNSRVTEAKFDEKNGFWIIKTASGDTVTAEVAVAGIGPFAATIIPEIPGLNKFNGNTIHTAKWNTEINLKGKKVAVVGSGASAIQVVPAIAPEVKELKVFQRTPPWIIPKTDYEFSGLEKIVYNYLPFVQNLRRLVIYGLTEVLATAIVWDSPMTTLMETIAKWNINRGIKDPELRKKVTPTYRLGGIRMLISNDWYPTLARENVELIDHKVDEIYENGLIANGKKYEADIIVWATGYKSPSQGFPFPLTGKNGRTLANEWEAGAVAFRGVSISGFPNLFLLMGPNTGPGHTSVLVYVEAQQDYIIKAIQQMEKNRIKSIDPKESKQKEFNDFIDKRMKQTTWGSGGESWYYTKDGRNTTLYPGFATEYVESIASFNLNDYVFEKK